VVGETLGTEPQLPYYWRIPIAKTSQSESAQNGFENQLFPESIEDVFEDETGI
jgi:hypothetical protein